MRTCKRLGIKTVAVYSEADANAVSLCASKYIFSLPAFILFLFLSCENLTTHAIFIQFFYYCKDMQAWENVALMFKCV